ncbi:MAG: hypothetical protein ACR2MP_19845 [Streptosporangiaceae bacterium]
MSRSTHLARSALLAGHRQPALHRGGVTGLRMDVQGAAECGQPTGHPLRAGAPPGQARVNPPPSSAGFDAARARAASKAPPQIIAGVSDWSSPPSTLRGPG